MTTLLERSEENSLVHLCMVRGLLASLGFSKKSLRIPRANSTWARWIPKVGAVAEESQWMRTATCTRDTSSQESEVGREGSSTLMEDTTKEGGGMAGGMGKGKRNRKMGHTL